MNLDAFIQQSMTEVEKAPVAEAWEPTDEEMVERAGQLAKVGYRPFDPQAFRAVCRYLAARKAKRTNMGLWLHGAAGTGKTMLLTVMLPEYKRLLPSWEVAQLYREHEGMTEGFWTAIGCDKAFCRVEDPATLSIDDVGEEPVTVAYGQKVDVLAGVICEVYRMWQRQVAFLRITTNLTPAQLDARYGRRVTDRLREMCTAIEFRGQSNRGRTSVMAPATARP